MQPCKFSWHKQGTGIVCGTEWEQTAGLGCNYGIIAAKIPVYKTTPSVA